VRRIVRISRGLLSGAFFLLYGLFALPFALVLPLPIVSKRNGRRIIRFFYRCFVFLAHVTGLYTVEVAGGATARTAGGTGRVVVMNHVSLIDICVLLANLGDAVCIAKSATARNPFLAAEVRKLFIANDGGGPAELAEAAEYISAGVDVVIFPQGTRGGAKLRRGAARLALATGARIVAYNIAYDPVVLAKGQPWWDVGDRVIRIRLERRGELAPDGPNDRPAAVALTKRIGELIGAAEG